MKIIFAAFHVDDPTRGGGSKEINSYHQMISWLFSSVKKYHPDSCCAILTDLHSFNDPKNSLGQDMVFRSEVDFEKIMLDRLLCQIAFLKSIEDASVSVVFLDTDIILAKSLSAVFNDDFSVALTVREDAEMPVNGGVFFVKSGRVDKAVEFFEIVRDIYLKKYADRAGWWGDQLAIKSALDFMASAQPKGRLTFADIKLLPCDLYNFSPPYVRLYSDTLFGGRGVFVWHFKGERKSAMKAFYNFRVGGSLLLKLYAFPVVLVFSFQEGIKSLLVPVKKLFSTPPSNYER